MTITEMESALRSAQSELDCAYKGQKLNDGTLMLRVGVDTAGELLDGVRHHAFPQ